MLVVVLVFWIVVGFFLLKLFFVKGLFVFLIIICYVMIVVFGLFYGVILWWVKRELKIENLLVLFVKF